MCPRNITERNIALNMHKNHFCLIWMSRDVNFNKAIEDELEKNFKVVDNCITDKHVESYFEYEHKQKSAISIN